MPLPLAPAPDLRAATAWRNVERAPDLHHDFAGQVIVLLFFTPSCVHSRQALLILTQLDARYAGRAVAVLGVATPRDPADARLDEVLAELRVEFPVALDGDGALWQAYECGAWPTLVLIDGTGRVRFHGIGEPDLRALVAGVNTLLAEIEYGGQITVHLAVARTPLLLPARTELAQPAGLAFDPARNEVWVADTGHDRVLALDADSGKVRVVVGGLRGASDGGATAATFAAPRGLCFAPLQQRLLVADAGNHALRAVDAAGNVVTLLGNGACSHDRGGGARGVGQGLAAPWGMCVVDGAVVLALAGAHQLWQMEVPDGVAVAAVGSGVLGRDDGAAQLVRMAHPSAVAAAGAVVAFCDLGNHAVRVWDRAAGTVQTLVGTDAVPGDADGEFANAKLQQPGALVFCGDDLLVADTGNGKIKRLDRARRHVHTLALDVPLLRPAALALHQQRLFIADAARRVIVVVDLGTLTARELSVTVPAPAPRAYAVRVRAYADCTLKLPLALPAGASVHPDLGVRVALSCVRGAVLAVDMEYEARVEGSYAVVRGVKTAMLGEGVLRATVRYFTRHGEGCVAHRQQLVMDAAVTLHPDAPAMALWAEVPAT
jgi:sugar lactone lactonase YvrE/thiol-disulfide isomerase/thioredoxin